MQAKNGKNLKICTICHIEILKNRDYNEEAMQQSSKADKYFDDFKEIVNSSYKSDNKDLQWTGRYC